MPIYLSRDNPTQGDPDIRQDTLPPKVVGGRKQIIFRIFASGRDTGKYALSREKALAIKDKIDPSTGKKRKPTWMKKRRSSER